MRKLIEIFKAPDKIAHTVIGLVFFLGCLLFTTTEYALAFTVVLALAKEINDQFGIVTKKSTASILDFIATITIPLIIHLINLYIL
ncbi:hypothetical protein [Winogradskyella pulchriflava]|uniref:Phosphatidate cytidylyltransferase n=1 Tax=Winogradskyella pulchriflava TaxID=1110688 RepID=A0ABV6QF66_9FLAO